MSRSDPHKPGSREEFGQLVPVVLERRMPTAAEYDAFGDENRARAIAAAAHDVVRSPDRAERVWVPRPAADLADRLGTAELAVWADADVLHVLWRGSGCNPVLGGGLQGLPLWRVDGLDSVWEVSLRVTDLQRSLISVMVITDDARPVRVHAFRGALRKEVQRVEKLAALVVDSFIESTHLGAARALSVYRHPGWHNRCHVVLVADGQNVHEFAPYVESAVDAGRIPPMALVGIHTGADRHLEYLPYEVFATAPNFSASELARAKIAFDSHMAFVLDEVIGWVGEQLGHTDPDTRFVQGNSNGAAWALTACQLHSKSFGGAIGFSVAGSPPTRVNGDRRHRYALSAGTLEPFLNNTEAWARALSGAGHDVDFSSYVNGHDWQFWAEQLPTALSYVTSTGNGQSRP